MTAQTILYLIIAFVILDTVVGGILSWLNRSWMTKPIPAILQGIYDEEQYARQQAYQRVNKRVAWIEEAISLVITLAVLACGIFGLVDDWCKDITSSTVWEIALFLLLFNTFNTIIELPFAYYSTFVIEERFGFNKTTRKTFWLDTIKSFVVSYLLTAGLLIVLYLIYEAWGEMFWIWASILVIAVMMFFMLFYSNLIVPLFNKQKPLPEGELRDAIEQAVRDMGQRFKDIYLIDGSKRSTKANAYFTGFGPKKRIVLYDTLLEQMTTAEIVAVLAHEMGHYRHHDTIKNMIMSIVNVVAYLFLFSLLASSPLLPEALGGTAPSFVLSLVAFSVLMSPLSLLISPVANALSRRAERAADAFAADYGNAEALISGLKKLSAHNLSNLTPHPAVVWFEYSHPTLEQRVTALSNHINQHKHNA